MPVECTNPNLKSAEMAQLGQPAKNWNWICTFLRHIRAKSKNSFVIRGRINDEGREIINLYHVIYLWKHYKLVKKQLFIIAAGFGSSYGVAIGFSLTSAVELVYWMFIKPFGLEKQEQCSKCHFKDFNILPKKMYLLQQSLVN